MYNSEVPVKQIHNGRPSPLVSALGVPAGYVYDERSGLLKQTPTTPTNKA
jgi:hypothetical protein